MKYLLFIIIGRSPIFSHTNTTINGLSTIRAFKSHDDVINEFNTLQDNNTSACFLFNAAARALALWSELVCSLYMACVIAIFLFFDRGK